ncbi:MAG: hypothetical protein MK207_04890, partial [Saprospiraceae bacterium]|nr:hypothetical protein [Saprospiraceae bacterium]
VAKSEEVVTEAAVTEEGPAVDKSEEVVTEAAVTEEEPAVAKSEEVVTEAAVTEEESEVATSEDTSTDDPVSKDGVESTTSDDEEMLDSIVEDDVNILYDTVDLAPEGAAYIIQVSAVRKYQSHKYKRLLNYGKLTFEDIDDGIKRVMIVPEALTDEGLEGYKSKRQALSVLSSVISKTRFETAFVIKIVNGERIGEGFRTLEEERKNGGF